MISSKDGASERKPNWSATLLCMAGAIMNITALFSDGKGALVAVGCSLIAIGAAMYNKDKTKR